MKQLAIALIASTLSTAALADAAALQKNNCLACHAVDKKLVGPAFKDVAAKYSGVKNADMTLAKKIRNGGSGVWGPIPMPANPKLSETEAKSLAQWILNIK
jgi:cytochrome c